MDVDHLIKIRLPDLNLLERVTQEMNHIGEQFQKETQAAIKNLVSLHGDAHAHCGKTSFIASCSQGARGLLNDLFAPAKETSRTR